MPYSMYMSFFAKFDGGTGNVIGDVMELPSETQHVFGRCLLSGAFLSPVRTHPSVLGLV